MGELADGRQGYFPSNYVMDQGETHASWSWLDLKTSCALYKRAFCLIPNMTSPQVVETSVTDTTLFRAILVGIAKLYQSSPLFLNPVQNGEVSASEI